MASHSAQAWVFDTGPVGGCVVTEVTPCLRAQQEPPNASNRPNKYLISRTPPQVRLFEAASKPHAKKKQLKNYQSPLLQVIFIFGWPQVVVKLEVPAYEDRTSLNFMRSFSRTPSPTCSLNHPIYESVEKRGTASGTSAASPRARLYTADYAYAVHRPGSSEAVRTHRRSESCDTRPHR